jgi:tetratricopeptide (TPR) repeat protein
MRPTTAIPHALVLTILLAGLPARAQAQAAEQEASINELQEWQYHNNAAWRYLNKGDFPRAEERFKLAIKVILPYPATSQRLLARSYTDLARVLYHEGRYTEAQPLATWGLKVRESNPKTTPESIFQSLYTLGVIHRAQKHYAEARSLIERALALQEQAVSSDHPSLSLTIEELAHIEREDSRYQNSERLYLRAIKLREKQNIPDNLDLADLYKDFAELLHRMKRDEEATAWQAKARVIRDTAARLDQEDATRKIAEGYRGFK